MRPRRYDAGTTIVKRGDKLDCIMMLKSGIIDVTVPVFEQKHTHRRNISFTSSVASAASSEVGSSPSARNRKLESVFTYGKRLDNVYLDHLNPGSCFCIYSAFTDD